MRVVTAAEMRALDRFASGRIGIPGPVLMESAGRSVFAAVAKAQGRLRGRKALVLCGSGNNGGDGFVAARYLALAGADVDIRLLGEPKTRDSSLHLRIARKMGIPVAGLKGVRELNAAPAPAFVVDAIFGTGLERKVAGLHRDAIAWTNDFKGPVYAVDIPSGLHTDTGEVLGQAVRAAQTVTFAFKKRGFFLRQGPERAGRVRVADISIAEEWADRVGAARLFETERRDVSGAVGPRALDSHKGTFGHLLVLGGCPEKSGAAVLASLAALRAGAGLVTAAVPRSAHAIVKRQLVEGMTELLPDREGRLAKDALPKILRICRGKDAVVIGPGLKQHDGLQDLVTRLLATIGVPVVVDADGLNALGTSIARLGGKCAHVILTPHPGEMARLTGRATAEIQSDRIGAARRLSEESGATVVLKGAYTVVARNDGETYLNPTGNPGMATAGMGDVLSGILGSYLAQRIPLGRAAVAAVFHHGLAGDRAARRLGPKGLLARDLIEELPRICK